MCACFDPEGTGWLCTMHDRVQMPDGVYCVGWVGLIIAVQV